MDTFFEQIVSMKITTGKRVLAILMLVCAMIISVGAVLVMSFWVDLTFPAMIAIFGVWFGSYRFVQNSKVEFEYIITNGELDVDKIVAKSRRKRLASIKCSEIERIVKYNPNEPADRYKKEFICCNIGEEAYAITVRDRKEGMIRLVIAPDDRLKSAMAKYIPRILLKDAFQ